jgi:CheY-like chemotaxis protein
MPDGGSITIRTANVARMPAGDFSAELAPADYVMVAVSDTGVGIAPDLRERVFEPFFSTKPTGKGTGLGLSSVFGFVKQSGGHVMLDSDVGQGTTVTLFLPRAAGTFPHAQKTLRPAAAAARERVLLVEDDPNVRRTVATMLTSLGYALEEAEDAGAALEVLDGPAEFDLLLTDVVMPGPMSGWELAIEARQRRPGLKVLLITGYSEEMVAAEASAAAEAPAVLRKPFRKEDLATMLRQALTG